MCLKKLLCICLIVCFVFCNVCFGEELDVNSTAHLVCLDRKPVVSLDDLKNPITFAFQSSMYLNNEGKYGILQYPNYRALDFVDVNSDYSNMKIRLDRMNDVSDEAVDSFVKESWLMCAETVEIDSLPFEEYDILDLAMTFRSGDPSLVSDVSSLDYTDSEPFEFSFMMYDYGYYMELDGIVDALVETLMNMRELTENFSFVVYDYAFSDDIVVDLFVDCRIVNSYRAIELTDDSLRVAFDDESLSVSDYKKSVHDYLYLIARYDYVLSSLDTICSELKKYFVLNEFPACLFDWYVSLNFSEIQFYSDSYGDNFDDVLMARYGVLSPDEAMYFFYSDIYNDDAMLVDVLLKAFLECESVSISPECYDDYAYDIAVYYGYDSVDELLSERGSSWLMSFVLLVRSFDYLVESGYIEYVDAETENIEEEVVTQ